MNLERIVWDDAGEFGDENETWINIEQLIKNYHAAEFVVESVGYVVYEDSDSVIISQNFEPHYLQVSNHFRIPKKMLIHRQVLTAEKDDESLNSTAT